MHDPSSYLALILASCYVLSYNRIQIFRERLSEKMCTRQARAELLKAWLALTIGEAVSKPIRCQGIKRLLTLTMLRATGPRKVIWDMLNTLFLIL